VTERLVFGGLAVIVLLVQDGRSMALRPRLSTGLPLSNKLIERCKQNEPGFSRLAREDQLFFGGLAVMVLLVQDGRPIALRPRLSTGLPFRFYL
jgi:hypothetical protein